MKVFILGAGATGSIIAKLLAENSAVEQVLVGDINAKKARKFLLLHPKITFKTLDASKKEDVAAALKDFNLLINAALPDFNKVLMEAAWEAGVNYQDLATYWDDNKVEQLTFYDKFKEKGLVGLINASASPGVTNLMAAELAEKLKRIDYVKIRLLENVSSDTPFTAWSKETAFDEFTWKPVVWEYDHLEKRNNFGGEEIFNFPEPFMNERCYLISQEEVGTIPLYIKTKYVDIKAGGSEIAFARMLYKLGLLRNRPIKVGEIFVSPYEFMIKVWPDVLSLKAMKQLVESGSLHNAYFWAAVEEAGISERKKKVLKTFIMFPPQTEVNKFYPGANYISYAAGLTAAIFALHIPKIRQHGVFPPEALDPEVRASLISEFKKNNIKIEFAEE